MTTRSQQTPGAQTRAALYARISTDDPKLQGDNFSIEAQLTEMRDYAQKRDWVVVSEFIDIGVSGTDTNRPGLNDLKEAVAQGVFEVVLVHELSRLSRSSVYDTFAIFEYLGNYKVGFASVKEPQFDLSSINGRFLLGILAAVNQYYVDILKMHTKKGKHQRVRMGLYNASTPPYGYRHTGDSKTPPVIEPEEAKAVRMIFKRYVSGRYSYQDLADMLNTQGYRTRSGKNFSKDTVADMLRNRFYAGKVVYKEGSHSQQVGEVYDGQHEALITEGLWEACHKVRERHHSASRTTQPQVRPYMLGGLVHCHVCKRRLRAQGSTTGGYYREMSSTRGFLDCPNARVGTRVIPLHKQMGTIIKHVYLPEDWQDELAEIIGTDEELDTLHDRRARLTAERRRLKLAWVRGDFQDEDPDLYHQELERIRRELNLIPSQDELAQLQQAAQQVESLRDIWDDAEEVDQRDLMHLMFRRVMVDVPQGRMLLLYPTAPFIPLLRNVPLLKERELGTFVPVWPPDMASSLSIKQLAPLQQRPDHSVNLPFLPVWPWPHRPQQRISPPLSIALKLRRQFDLSGGRAIAVPHVGVPEHQLDGRKWPNATLEQFSLETALNQDGAAPIYLDTPLCVQLYPDRDALAQQVFDVLAEQATWHWIDLLPAAMPAHWLFTYFPATWTYAQSSYWTTYHAYNQLKKVGFHVLPQEHTYYQAISLRAALSITQQRSGVLQLLNNDLYQQGLKHLQDEIQAQGADTLIGSEVALIEVTAIKGELPKDKRWRKR